MPWRTKREVLLILIGAAVVALSIIVFAISRDASSDVLAAVGLLGGVAIVLNTTPTNGHKNGDG